MKINIDEITNTRDKYNQLSKIQQANCDYSISWKQNAAKVLYTKDKEEFYSAVWWIGVTGNVSRTVPNTQFETFAKFMFDNRDKISSGELKITDIELQIDKKPISWISKICHIMNPHKYPLIYDENIRSALGIKDAIQFVETTEDFRNKITHKKIDDIYKMDSIIWASQTRSEWNDEVKLKQQ